MVNNAATVGRSGVHDFILLRASAVVLALYTLFIAGFFIITPEVTFEIWNELFSSMCMKIATLISIISLLAHAWIGIWQVLSDYIKSAALRGTLQFVFSLTLLGYLVATFIIVWGV